MADFIWHPGMKLSHLQKRDWVNGIFGIFDNSGLAKRFTSAWPLYGLRWSLIVLNEFLEAGWYKRVYANDNLNHLHQHKLENQLNKAKNICKKIQKTNMKCPYIDDLDE